MARLTGGPMMPKRKLTPIEEALQRARGSRDMTGRDGPPGGNREGPAASSRLGGPRDREGPTSPPMGEGPSIPAPRSRDYSAPMGDVPAPERRDNWGSYAQNLQGGDLPTAMDAGWGGEDGGDLARGFSRSSAAQKGEEADAEGADYADAMSTARSLDANRASIPDSSFGRHALDRNDRTKNAIAAALAAKNGMVTPGDTPIGKAIRAAAAFARSPAPISMGLGSMTSMSSFDAANLGDAHGLSVGRGRLGNGGPSPGGSAGEGGATRGGLGRSDGPVSSGRGGMGGMSGMGMSRSGPSGPSTGPSGPSTSRGGPPSRGGPSGPGAGSGGGYGGGTSGGQPSGPSHSGWGGPGAGRGTPGSERF